MIAHTTMGSPRATRSALLAAVSTMMLGSLLFCARSTAAAAAASSSYAYQSAAPPPGGSGGDDDGPQVVSTIYGGGSTTIDLSASDSSSYAYEFAPPPSGDAGPRLVSAIYSFGDSTIDVGNNNYLDVSRYARANVPPYGRDFDTHQATGRQSNGRLVVDFLTKKLNFSRFPAPVLAHCNATDTDGVVSPGVNLASSDSGVLAATGTELGHILGLADQVRRFREDVAPAVLARLDGVPELAAAHLADALFVVSTGSNDLLTMDVLARVLRANGTRSGAAAAPPPAVGFDPATYTQDHMVAALWEQIRLLYSAGARRFVVMEIGPLGCTPSNLAAYGSDHGECYAPLNDQVEAYNRKVSQFLAARFEAGAALPGANYVVAPTFDALKAIASAPGEYGFKRNAACCGEGAYGGALPCQDSKVVCEDADEYVWFDAFHPSQKTYSLLADKIWETIASFFFSAIPV